MMRLWLALLFLILAPGLSWGQMVHQQSACSTGDLTGGTNSFVYTPAGAVTSGRLLVAYYSTPSANITSIVGNAGTTFDVNGSQVWWGNGNTTQWKAVAAGADTSFTITTTTPPSAGDQTFCLLEFSGNRPSQSTATSNYSVTTNTTTHPSNSVQPNSAYNVVVAGITHASGATWTYDPAFTSVTTGSSVVWVGYLIQAAADSQEASHDSDTNRTAGSQIGAFPGVTGDEDKVPTFKRRFMQ